MKKLLLGVTLSFALVLGACGNEDAEKKEDSKKSESVEKKKEAPKKDESKKDTDKKDNESTEQTEQVATEETQSQEQQQQQQPVTQEEPAPAEQQQTPVQEQQTEQVEQPEVDENYINRDGEFYDSLPQYEKDKMSRQLEAQESADEDDPRWDEQLEINMRDDLSDAERDQLSDEVWSN